MPGATGPAKSQEPGEDAKAPTGGLLGANRDWTKRPPSSPADALQCPLELRSRLALDRDDVASWTAPESWPEVRMSLVAYRSAVKKPNERFLDYKRDPGIRALVALFAAGFSANDVCEVIPRIVASPWWSEKPRDLGSITLTVVRRALAEVKKPETTGELAALPRPMFGGSQ